MDWDIMLDVIMSMVFFAPVAIVLGIVIFVGCLMAVEAIRGLPR